jgi:hypothetical protein
MSGLSTSFALGLAQDNMTLAIAEAEKQLAKALDEARPEL